ncbi:MAG: plasmid stabilization protein [Rhodanobacter sp.]
MATMTIRNLDDDLKTLLRLRLRLRAARHGQSMEEEARRILRSALAGRVEDDSGASLYAAIRARVEPLGGVELALPPRELQRDPPDFGEPDADK